MKNLVLLVLLSSIFVACSDAGYGRRQQGIEPQLVRDANGQLVVQQNLLVPALSGSGGTRIYRLADKEELQPNTQLNTIMAVQAQRERDLKRDPRTPYMLLDNGYLSKVVFYDVIKQFKRSDLNLTTGFASYLACKNIKADSKSTQVDQVKLYVDDEFENRLTTSREDYIVVTENNVQVTYKRVVKEEAALVQTRLQNYGRQCSNEKIFSK